jgi:hypothetical protein
MSTKGSAVVLRDRQRGRRYTAQHKLTVLWQFEVSDFDAFAHKMEQRAVCGSSRKRSACPSAGGR